MTIAYVMCKGCRDLVRMGKEHIIKAKSYCDKCYKRHRKEIPGDDGSCDTEVPQAEQAS